MDFATMMTLEPHGPDTYVGIGPKYPWGGLYGGQIVAQALRAAAATVGARHRVHSLHAYFIRRGDHEEPIRFEVDRIRNGRSFTTRLVVARQAVGAILNMSASFQVDEPGPDAQTVEMPDVPRPGRAPGRDGLVRDVRAPARAHRGERGRALGWLRMADPSATMRHSTHARSAYMSDDLPTDAVVAVQYPRFRWSVGAIESLWSASLDHAIWFHRPVRADEWHLQEFTCHGLISSRGLSVGHVFDQAGTHLATHQPRGPAPFGAPRLTNVRVS